ncbi:hypothetical protein [Alkaliphilus metalliredigens]|nr:hypothetical protein [Alkaliphilus metalliredigens]
MEIKNKLSEVPLANLDSNHLEKVKKLEKELDDNYYLIAFKK